MKKLINKTLAFVYNAKVHASHTAIKGRKSGGQRDTNNVDWKEGLNGWN
jgi:hypothetical protein